MTATSGRKYCESLKMSGPVGSLVRMLLGTSLWGSTMYLMTWGGAGYTAQAFLIPASAVGASHKRERVFIVAHTDSRECTERLQRGVKENSAEGGTRVDGRSARFGQDSESMAISSSKRCGEAGEHFERSEEWVTGTSQDVAHTESGGRTSWRPEQSGQPRKLCSLGGSVSLKALADTNGQPRLEADSSVGSFRSKWNTRDDAGGGCWGSGAKERGRPTQSGVGGDFNGLPAWLDGDINPLDALHEIIASVPHPALLGMPQYDWEPPRVATGVKNRAARLKALGNAVVPWQVYPILYAIKLIHERSNRNE